MLIARQHKWARHQNNIITLIPHRRSLDTFYWPSSIIFSEIHLFMMWWFLINWPTGKKVISDLQFQTHSLYLEHSIWNCSQVNVTEPITSGNGLVPSASTLLPEPKLTQIYVAIWPSLGHNELNNSRLHSCCDRNQLIRNKPMGSTPFPTIICCMAAMYNNKLINNFALCPETPLHMPQALHHISMYIIYPATRLFMWLWCTM